MADYLVILCKLFLHLALTLLPKHLSLFFFSIHSPLSFLSAYLSSIHHSIPASFPLPQPTHNNTILTMHQYISPSALA